MKLHSDKCTQLVEELEGFRAEAYQDQGGVWSLGFGSTTYGGGRPVQKGDVVTKQVASIWQSMDLDRIDIKLNNDMPIPLVDSLTQNQWDAIVSLSYNIGTSAFLHSTLLKLLEAGDILGAASQFLVWNRVDGKVNQGIINRRTKEKALFEEAA